MVLISGIAVVDLIASGLERPAGPGELVFGSIRTALGGHACNVSVDLARLGLPHSRLKTTFPAGRDLFGEFLVRSLRREGLRPEVHFDAKAPTSLDLILVAKGEDRRYHADPGANIRMKADPVLCLLEKHRPGLFYAGGVGLLGELDTRLGDVLRRAKGLGGLTFVDAVSPFRRSWGFLKRALPWVDFFHCNAEEAAGLTGKTEPAAAVESIRRMGAKAVFLTLGGQGAVSRVPCALIRTPAFKVRVKDPTGAGDAFSAGLIYKIYEALRVGEAPLRFSVRHWLEAVIYASACGAVCTTGVGTTTAVDGGRVAALVKRQGKAVARAAEVSILLE